MSEHPQNRSTSGETVHTHSGQGRGAENAIVFTIAFLILLGSFALLGLWTFAPSWEVFAAGLLAYALTFFIPFVLLRSKTAKDTDGSDHLADH